MQKNEYICVSYYVYSVLIILGVIVGAILQ